jgi:uncharacterized phosphosugar-binding protein
MTGMAGRYLARVGELLDDLATSQAGPIEAAAEAVTRAIGDGHRVFVAATSHVLHTELYLRAGGLAAIHPLGEAPELTTPMLELSAGLLSGDGPFVPERGDVVLVGTNAGTDAGTVQAALAARDAGCLVVGLTIVAYERHPDVVVEHPSGARLVDVADIVVDIGGSVGDAELEIPGLPEPFGPASGALLVAASWAILSRAAELLAADGRPPIVYRGVQLPGGEALFHERRAHYGTTRRGWDPAPGPAAPGDASGDAAAPGSDPGTRT